jgi:hypothetical protein
MVLDSIRKRHNGSTKFVEPVRIPSKCPDDTLRFDKFCRTGFVLYFEVSKLPNFFQVAETEKKCRSASDGRLNALIPTKANPVF